MTVLPGASPNLQTRPLNRATISKMAKQGQIHLVYFGDVPGVPRTEAVRLGLISA
jgi:hypothetical protein